MTAPLPPPTFRTSCKLCRKPILEAPALNIPLLDAPDAQGMEYLTKLHAHMIRRHPDQAQAMMGAQNEFGGILLFSMFETEDPSPNARAELNRKVFVNQFANRITDVQISDAVSRLPLDQDQAAKVSEMMREFRDLLTERGKYAPPQFPADTPLVIVPR